MRNKLFSAVLLSLVATATAWAAAPDLQPIPASQAALLHKVHGFVWGAKTAPAKAIVFVDPNCLWCHRFFEQVQAGVAAGKARYLVVPVAILKKSSAAKAEQIMQSPNPQATFLRDERGFNTNTEEGGLPKTFPAAKQTIKNLLAINTAVLADLEGGKPATPTFIVSTPQGPALHEGFIPTPQARKDKKLLSFTPNHFRQAQVPVPPVVHYGPTTPLPRVQE
ncbi:MAG: thioredoxin fold domain-containing protein [Acidithiobacillus sp.]|jgi:thiol:disulfide interchange protein DsbG|nr:thioredoxin fold domain-containing protein [Acidithiobacillus sp.]